MIQTLRPAETPGLSKLDSLRKRHPSFTYDSFEVSAVEGSGLKASFHFVLEPDIHFRPDILIECKDQSELDRAAGVSLDDFVFHLGLVEMLSYWKAACSPEIIVSAGNLDSNQVDWWSDLLLKGMGEFFYVNQIDYSRKDFFRITVRSPREHGSPVVRGTLRNRPLVLASGGKDTAVTFRVLQEAGVDFDCLMLNPTKAALDMVDRSECRRAFTVRRTIDPLLLQLNNSGYLNGHTPFSAYLSFLGIASATAFGHPFVIASNERSSNEGNLRYLNGEVNHQYSKSVDFERKLREYVSAYLTPDVEYFSLLRPLYEIQIIRLFSEYRELFPVFKSCNRAERQESWCGKCPKCVCIFTLSYPFLDQRDLIGVFGQDLFQNDSTVTMLKRLTGTGGEKPFECVGTLDETIGALFLSVAKARAAGPLPKALRWAEHDLLPAFPDAGARTESILSDWASEHHLPPKFETFLRSKLLGKTSAEGN